MLPPGDTVCHEANGVLLQASATGFDQVIAEMRKQSAQFRPTQANGERMPAVRPDGCDDVKSFEPLRHLWRNSISNKYQFSCHVGIEANVQIERVYSVNPPVRQRMAGRLQVAPNAVN
jgi:hypothetical protein